MPDSDSGNPIRSIATHVSVAATIFLAGAAAVSKGYVIFGLALMGFAVLYLIYELIVSKPMRSNVPGMLRLLIAVFAVVIFMGLNRETIKGSFPTPAPPALPTPMPEAKASPSPDSQPTRTSRVQRVPTQITPTFQRPVPLLEKTLALSGEISTWVNPKYQERNDY